MPLSLTPRSLSVALALAVALTACGDPEGGEAVPGPAALEEAQTENTLFAVAQDEGLTSLITAINEAGLEETFLLGGPYTVFGPSDEAFQALPEGLLEMLLLPESREALAALLRYHVVPGAVMSEALSGETVVETVNGAALTVTAAAGGVTVTDALGNTATVVEADAEATNGVIHVVDRLLLPATPEELLGAEAL